MTGVPRRPFSTVKSDAASVSTSTALPSPSRNSTAASTRQPSFGESVQPLSPSFFFGGIVPIIRDVSGLSAMGMIPSILDAGPKMVSPPTTVPAARTWKPYTVPLVRPVPPIDYRDNLHRAPLKGSILHAARGSKLNAD